MKKPLVSVIVPIYDVEEYLDKCVASIREQTLEQIEIILVDDGSPDNCGYMCDEYAKTDDRIKVVHKINGGLSDARNAGIEVADADYVAFIDSDDYIDKDMMELLYNNMIKENADVSVCGFYHHFSDRVDVTENRIGYCVADNYNAVRLELTEVPVSAVNKIYSKKLFDKVKFPVGKLYEDAFTTIPVLLQTERVVYDLQPKYHYFHRENSITTKAYRPKVKDLIEASGNNLKLVEARYPDLKSAAEYRYFWSYYWVIEYMLRYELDEEATEDKRKMYRFLRKNTFKVVCNPFFRKTRKLAALILMVSSRLYEKMALAYMKRNYSTPSKL